MSPPPPAIPRLIRGDGSGNSKANDVEIASLTSIRGIAALWVVLLHSSAAIFGVLPEASFLTPLGDAGHFAVPLFFILSGYVLGLRYAARLESPTVGTVLRFCGCGSVASILCTFAPWPSAW